MPAKYKPEDDESDEISAGTFPYAPCLPQDLPLSEEEEDEETMKNDAGKKRALGSASKNPVPKKKAKLVSPWSNQKGGMDFNSEEDEGIPLGPNALKDNGKPVIKEEIMKSESGPAASNPNIPAKSKPEDDESDEISAYTIPCAPCLHLDFPLPAEDDDEEDEETPMKNDADKKRALGSAWKTPVPKKKAKLVSPWSNQMGGGDAESEDSKQLKIPVSRSSCYNIRTVVDFPRGRYPYRDEVEKGCMRIASWEADVERKRVEIALRIVRHAAAGDNADEITRMEEEVEESERKITACKTSINMMSVYLFSRPPVTYLESHYRETWNRMIIAASRRQGAQTR